MTHDQNKKTLRHFQCRDYLWEIFEQMSQELECSTDYLINEAMRQYARSRNYGTRSPSSPGIGRPSRPDNPTPGPIPSLRSSPGGRPAIPPAPPPPPPRSYPGSYGGSAPTPGQGGASQGYYPQAGSVGRPAGAYGSRPPPPPGQSSFPSPGPTNRPPAYPGRRGGAPPPLPGQQRAPMGSTQPPPLFVIFNGQKIPINKPEFVIGRGSKTADLPIKDGNISRRHAAVVWEGGAFWLKDLGSTNGVEYAGQRIEQKQIAEGDVFQICDYELRFTYR